ncbi:MAG: ribosome biogenesis GTPase YlqF [Lachnospiraceae bacterium]|nr:ribosome biogenesis GTPase YlqF [Lachnospiraceae bacterium]
MQFQWYPGHMTKAKRAMQEDIKLVDLVIELVDARVPLASRNPDIDELGRNKARLVVMNKADLADEQQNRHWQEWFKAKGCFVVMMDSRSNAGKGAVQKVIADACKEKTERDRRRGIMNRPVRAMVVGIPNVGKSTFINSIAGKACAKTGNKPGVTRGNQWIRLNKQVELLDTPGILWPKFEDQTVGLKLAMIGSIKDDIINSTELALEIINFLLEYYPGAIEKRYGVSDLPESVSVIEDEAADEKKALAAEILGLMAKARGCLKQGGEFDLDRMALLLVDDFRSGRLGRLTLEWID